MYRCSICKLIRSKSAKTLSYKFPNTSASVFVCIFRNLCISNLNHIKFSSEISDETSPLEDPFHGFLKNLHVTKQHKIHWPKYIETIEISPECKKFNEAFLEILKNVENVHEAMALYREQVAGGTCHLPFTTQHALAASLSRKGLLFDLAVVKSVCSVKYPDMFKHEMCFDHYVAEALGQNGQFEACLVLFKKLYHDHHDRRRKLVNMVKFVLGHILDADMKMTENERNENDHLLTYAKFMDYCARSGDIIPTAHLWKKLVQSKSTLHQRRAEHMLDSSPELVSAVQPKIKMMCEEAVKAKHVALLYQLVHTVEKFKMEKQKSNVFSSLMELYCITDDVEGAMEVLSYAQKNNITLKASTVEKMMSLARHAAQIPDKINPSFNASADSKNFTF